MKSTCRNLQRQACVTCGACSHSVSVSTHHTALYRRRLRSCMETRLKGLPHTSENSEEWMEAKNECILFVKCVRWAVRWKLDMSTFANNKWRRMTTNNYEWQILLTLWSDWMHSTAAHWSITCHARLVNDWLKFVHSFIYPPHLFVAVFLGFPESVAPKYCKTAIISV